MAGLVRLFLELVRALWVDKGWVRRASLMFHHSKWNFAVVSLAILAIVAAQLGFFAWLERSGDYSESSDELVIISIEYSFQILIDENLEETEFLTSRSIELIQNTIGHSLEPILATANDLPHLSLAAEKRGLSNVSVRVFVRQWQASDINRLSKLLVEKTDVLADHLRTYLNELEAKLPGKSKIVFDDRPTLGFAESRPNRTHPILLVTAGIAMWFLMTLAYVGVRITTIIDEKLLHSIFGDQPKILRIRKSKKHIDVETKLVANLSSYGTDLLVAYLKHRLSEKSESVIAVTSAQPWAGKTTLSIAIGNTIGIKGDVAVVDGDYMKPTITRLKPILDDHDSVPNLVCLPDNHPRTNYIEHMRDLILANKEVRHHIVDLPPLFAAYAAMDVLVDADLVILVVEELMLSRQSLESCKQLLDIFDIHPDVIVINRAKFDSTNFWTYDFDYGANEG